MQNSSVSRHYIVHPDGAAILDVERGTITTLNSIGGFVLQSLKRGDTIEMIVATLAERTGHDAAVITEDVRAFATDLERQQILP